MTLDEISVCVTACSRCPELVAYRESIAREKRRAYRDDVYWGRPVPAFGDPAARLVIVGLAPGAHGSNRTGRMFTGDDSGRWLYRALHRAGFADRPESLHRGDGLALRDCLITAAVRCVPPANKPTPAQRDRCFPFLVQEFAALRGVRVIVSLGKFADDAVAALVRRTGRYHGMRAPFAHGATSRADLPHSPDVTIVSSYHPSRQNTNTGVLSEPMLDDIFHRASHLIGG